MTPSTPPDNPWNDQAPPLLRGWSRRVGLLALLGTLLLGFSLAAALVPDTRGFGTHRQLGLPECTFRMLFGQPCPGCGMTTSFAHFVRGQWGPSFLANPAGLLFAICCTALVPWCIGSLCADRYWGVRDPIHAATWMLIIVGALACIVWVARVLGLAP